MTWQHWVMVVGLIIGGGLIFNLFSFFGQRMLRHHEEREKEKEEEKERAKEAMQGYDNLNVTE
jgi:hypothetical protein